MAASFVVAAVSWVAGYYAQESLRNQLLVEVFVIVFMVSGSSLMFFGAVRDKISRCPKCKSWLRSKGRVSERGTRIFTCGKCGVDWDSMVQEVGAG